MNEQECLYFAYGSCMNPHSFQNDVPEFKLIGKAGLKHYRVAFNKFSSKWGGAVADIVYDEGEHCEGVLYSIKNSMLPSLDEREGATQDPPIYRRIHVEVDLDDQKMKAWTYEVFEKEKESSPSEAYKNTILTGATLLSEAYLNKLKHSMKLIQ